MLQVNRINKRFGYNQVFRDVTFNLMMVTMLGWLARMGAGRQHCSRSLLAISSPRAVA